MLKRLGNILNPKPKPEALQTQPYISRITHAADAAPTVAPATRPRSSSAMCLTLRVQGLGVQGLPYGL